MRLMYSLIGFLHEKLPNDKTLEIAATTAKMASDTLVMKHWGKYVMKYADEIENHDEHFFRHTDLTKEYNKDDFDISKDEFQFRVAYFRELWDTDGITDKDKAEAWKYMEGLVRHWRDYNKASEEAKKKGADAYLDKLEAKGYWG